MGTKSKYVEGGLGMAMMYYVVSSRRKPLEEKSFSRPRVGVGQAQELEHASRRLSEPCWYRRLFVRTSRQVESVCVVSGSVWMMMTPFERIVTEGNGKGG